MKIIIVAPPQNCDEEIRHYFENCLKSAPDATVVYLEKKADQPINAVVLLVPMLQKWNKKVWYSKQVQNMAAQGAVVYNFQPFVLALTVTQYCFTNHADEKLAQEVNAMPNSVVMLPSLALQHWYAENGLPKERTRVVPPYKAVSILDYPQQATIKLQLSNGREYFLLEGANLNIDKLVEAIKSFSQFKKWQLSGLKLVIVGLDTSRGKALAEKLEHYKYRDDVIVANSSDEVYAAAFAYIYTPSVPCYSYGNLLPFFQRSVPVITYAKDAVVELADAVLLIDDANNLSMGSHMVTLYKDEKARRDLIKSGKNIAATSSLCFEEWLGGLRSYS